MSDLEDDAGIDTAGSMSGDEAAVDGFADAMGKILGEHVAEDVNPVMLKRKTEQMRAIERAKAKQRAERAKREKRGARVDPGYVPPSGSDPASLTKERQLRRLATTGVVTLFNTIRKVQKQEKTEQQGAAGGAAGAAPLKSLSKGDFLGMLKGGGGGGAASASVAGSGAGGGGPSKGTGKGTASSFLADDYMLGGKMSDWHSGQQAQRPKGPRGAAATMEAAGDEDLGWDDDVLPTQKQIDTAKAQERGEQKKRVKAEINRKQSARPSAAASANKSRAKKRKR